jgi:hypothetical protein
MLTFTPILQLSELQHRMGTKPQGHKKNPSSVLIRCVPQKLMLINFANGADYTWMPVLGTSG